jgi:hypothetical protein
MSDYICRTCQKPCEDWGELADHILKCCKIKGNPHNKDRSGKMWAKRYVHKNAINKLMKIGREFNPPTPLTDGQREAKQDSRRELSGKVELVNTLCIKGKHNAQQLLPVEYTRSPQAWRENGILVVICDGCKRE